ncbi:MAG: Glutaminase 2 [Firmicutes bacterium]|nr:Glutaminase 2 [candidate division NPL-UPA2 bacterium]
MFSRIGMEPTGDSFNSLMRLETFSSLKPVNPLVNAGAIATTALIRGNSVEEKFDRLTEFIRSLAPGCYVGFNAAVYQSESLSGDRNRAIAYFLRDIGALEGNAEESLDLYFRQCSLEADCFTLATLAGALAECHKTTLLPRQFCRIIRTFMFTCGMYNASGEFAVKVGFPAKSGVSGAILGVVPGSLGIGVYGPSLDPKGNSVAGVALLAEFSERANLYLL